jgi:hypothetical protein
MSSKRRLFQAQVDGVFAEANRDAKSKRKLSKVILEVKPFVRFDEYHIRYQEAAQIVAWIAQEHSDKNPLWPVSEDGLYRSVSSFISALL